MDRGFTRLALYELIKESLDKSIDEKFQFLENRVAEITRCPDAEKSSLKRSLSHFKSDFKKKWSSANRKEERFLQKNRDWLENIIQVPIYSSNFRCRPQKDFIESSERSKRRKTVELRQQSNPQELTFAAFN
ncbi:hypothetical protein AVEN_51500-1 [Araneus ventricosus]|uniref:Uncharacterized protein n=1 Tax=Araneus ventricosus TaxID=182803 RepID=A0A4Y2XA98_ARAVE|nr:hypothetical protein AVEN_51500-1 [Araneus ventricosus]